MVRFLEVTLPNISDNLDYDAALLDAVDADPQQAALRVWESPAYTVIVGKSNDIAREVNIAACEADGVPILRRPSGGGAVVLGPGCLCFSLALPVPSEFVELGISGVTRAVMQRLADALSSSTQPVIAAGISDLAIGGRKFSGNSQRWKKRAFLHHGTILYDFDLPRISRYLKHPSREPDYRCGRSHPEFVANLPLPYGELVRRICDVREIITPCARNRT